MDLVSSLIPSYEGLAVDELRDISVQFTVSDVNIDHTGNGKFIRFVSCEMSPSSSIAWQNTTACVPLLSTSYSHPVTGFSNGC